MESIPLMPIVLTNPPRTAPPTIIPPRLDANMYPFAFATSSSRRTSTARASVLTSCREAKMLCTNMSLITRSI